ncbi:MAG: hypothetical protein WAX44_01785 [Minisyncoccia bacterium]
MLYLIHGKDTIRARKKLHELLDFAKKKRPEAELFKITTENWSDVQLEELLVSQGLFDPKYTVVLDNLFEKKEIKEFVLGKFLEMSESEQLFFMLEGVVDATSLKKIEKHAKQVQKFDLREDERGEYNIFSITSGLLERDRKKLWISYLDSIEKGSAPEEIHGIFFWQIKNMILASRSQSQTESGLSPFVYKNALSGTRKYKTEELVKMSGDLVDMTHRVRTGKGEMEVMLESWVLGI